MVDWLGSSLNQIQGWTTVRESYSRALEHDAPSLATCKTFICGRRRFYDFLFLRSGDHHHRPSVPLRLATLAHGLQAEAAAVAVHGTVRSTAGCRSTVLASSLEQAVLRLHEIRATPLSLTAAASALLGQV